MDQSLKVYEIFPRMRIVVGERHEVEENEDEDDDDEENEGCDKSVDRDTMELDFNELTFN